MTVLYSKCLLLFSVVIVNAASALEPLDDDALAAETGQSLLALTYLAPGQTGNLEPVANNIGFYKLSVQGKLEVNANIRKLQLGCDGANGGGACDIDIDNLSLSGQSNTSDGRAGSSAVLTNPFVEFAIRNPNSVATREVLGVRLSAAQLQGQLTTGTENVNSANGINTLSGYLKTTKLTGTAVTQARNMTFADTGLNITGTVQGRLFGSSPGTTCVGGFLDPCISVNFSSNDYNLALQPTSVPFELGAVTVNGTRISSVVASGDGTVGAINFSGPLKATVAGLLNLNKQTTGNITGLIANITLTQDLGFIHKIPLNNPLSLSVQKQDINWQGSVAAAKRGWWLALEDEVDIGNVSPTNPIPISNAILQQVVPAVSQNLTSNPRNCGNLLTGCVGGSALDVGNINLSANPSRFLPFPLVDLQLASQTFAPNCWGGRSFC